MAKPAARIAFVQVMMAVAVVAIVGKSARLQLYEHRTWTARAQSQRTKRVTLVARRGSILDRTGVLLAQTRESYRFGIAPNEVEDIRGLARIVAQSIPRLHLSAAAIEHELRTRRYVYMNGPFSPTEMERIRPLKGVHIPPEDVLYQRVYPAPNLALGTIGTVADGVGNSGVEKALETVLAGVPGEAVQLKDHAGRQFDSPRRAVREPIPGNDVWLTIDAGLQEIAEHALDEAIAQLKARGGDVVFLDPGTGEVLALASRLADGSVSSSALVTPIEPGSTAKLFTAAALLRAGKVAPTDAVSGENGRWLMQIPGRRPVTRNITDAHAENGMLTLAKAIEVSSNIGMAKFSQRLTNEEQYDMLRDFGFGMKTGVEVSLEADGTLFKPRDWEPMSRASLAMGYYMEVTPLQLAAAYGAIANDGLLLAPTLVREIRSPDAEVLYRHQKEPVRQVISKEVAATLHEYLKGAVSTGGTGDQAQLENFTLVGKTGTAHKLERGRYIQKYTASFASIFPADHPQLVAIVILDAPSVGSYYGGQTAAPLTKRMLEEALAARESAINRKLLVEQDTTQITPAPAPRAQAPPPAAAVPTVAVVWPYRPDTASRGSGPVPDVTGIGVRAAATVLHRRGFRVVLDGLGAVARTEPAAGTTAAYGSTVTVFTQRH